MGDVLGQLLPYALGVAVSPVPIIAVILMLLSPRAGGAAAGFLVGWLAAIVVVTTVFVLLAGVIGPSEDGSPSPVVGWIKLGLGALLLILAAGQFRRRPGPGEVPALPGWMAAIDEVTPLRAVGLGAALAGINPKNLGLCLAAGSTVGGAGLGSGEAVVAVAVFTLLAASSVAVPVVAQAVAADRMRSSLQALHGWLVQENAVIMGVLLTVLGVVLLGHGIAGVTT